MKKIVIYIAILGMVVGSSCNDWLDVLPKDEQVTADYWKSKEEVESVLSSGYMFLRNTTQRLVVWGEVRGQSVYSRGLLNAIRLQDFQLTSTDVYCNWSEFYRVINMANSVIKYAPEAFEQDETYLEGAMNAHICEAYFLRTLVHFILLRNFGEIPLIIHPYVNDEASFNVAKSSQAEVIAQIKEDIRTALETGAAREFFEDDNWEGASKGRATKWALYALMADVCLWNEDYDECIQYADLLINATATRRPAFMTESYQWFEIFYPGNSNESIFEINWDSVEEYRDYSPSSYFTYSINSRYQYSEAMCERLRAENEEATDTGIPSVRAEWGAYADIENTEESCVWKYTGVGYSGTGQRRGSTDVANFIIYRMADVMLMKAEALIWRGAGGYEEALDIMNTIRNRSGLRNLDIVASGVDELTMLEAVLHERDMELAAEGKRWYDLLRFGKTKNYRYKSEFIDIIVENSQTGNPTWLRSVLKNEDAWYLPINKTELEANPLLVQNPYYGTN